MNFSKLLDQVKIVRSSGNGSSFYDPETDQIVIPTGWLARTTRKLLRRSDNWILGHELGHAFLERCNSKVRKKLGQAFGDLSEKAYCGDSLKELRSLLFSYDRDLFITARATLCPEEDFAETFAFLYCKAMDTEKGFYHETALPLPVLLKVSAIKNNFSP